VIGILQSLLLLSPVKSQPTEKAMTTTKFNVHETITTRIVEAIEKGAGNFLMPWHGAAALRRPVNVNTGRAYNGVNILSLWITAQERGFDTSEWATFKQWQDIGACVRKGEKGTPIVFYKLLEVAGDSNSDSKGRGDDETRNIPFARASWAFNANQVEGYSNKSAAPAAPSLFERLESVEDTIRATGADIAYGGLRAFYNRATDHIAIPAAERFRASPTSGARESFYSTILHELTHWTGAPHRLNREKGKKFADKPYCFEELIAELGAAFLCADLGISNDPRPDHAQYIAPYLTLLKEDSRAIFRAATAASEATAYVLAAAERQQIKAA
jgi:antirestriction protein ArdC